jgi:hypothetical protein
MGPKRPLLDAVEKMTPENRARYEGMCEVYDLIRGLVADYEIFAKHMNPGTLETMRTVSDIVRGQVHDRGLALLQQQLQDTGQGA